MCFAQRWRVNGTDILSTWIAIRTSFIAVLIRDTVFEDRERNGIQTFIGCSNSCKSVCFAALSLIVTATAIAVPCAAETLLEALASTYQYSPTIDAERARQRARDEDIARAESGYRPDISATSTVGREQNTIRTQFPNVGIKSLTSPRGWSVDLVQPVFRGFQTTNAVNATEASGSGRARDTEERRTAGIARCCNGIRRCRA